MTSTSDFAGYVRADYRLFASPEAWMAREASLRAWQAATQHVPPQYRKSLFTGSPLLPANSLRSYRIDPHTGKKNYRTPAQEEAVKEYAEADRHVRADVIKKMKAGDLLLALRDEKKGVPGEYLLCLEGEIEELSFSSFNAFHKPSLRKYIYKIRDNIGSCFEQALLIYGDPRLVSELEDLVIAGAPERLGHMPAGAGDRPDRAARYHEIRSVLKDSLLSKLCAGELVAEEAGKLITPEWWATPTTWRPEVSILPASSVSASEEVNLLREDSLSACGAAESEMPFMRACHADIVSGKSVNTAILDNAGKLKRSRPKNDDTLIRYARDWAKELWDGWPKPNREVQNGLDRK